MSKRSQRLRAKEQNIKIEPKEYAIVTTNAFIKYRDDSKTNQQLERTFRETGWYEISEERAKSDFEDGITTSPCRLRYLPLQTNSIRNKLNLDAEGRTITKKQQNKRTLNDMEEESVALMARIMNQSVHSALQPETAGSSARHQSQGHLDFFNSCTSDTENVRRATNNLLWKQQERLRIDAKKARAKPLIAVREAENALNKKAKRKN